MMRATTSAGASVMSSHVTEDAPDEPRLPSLEHPKFRFIFPLCHLRMTGWEDEEHFGPTRGTCGKERGARWCP